MAKGEEEEDNQADNVVSYFKSLTLEKKYGTTGSVEMEHGAVYIGYKSLLQKNILNSVSRRPGLQRSKGRDGSSRDSKWINL